MDTRPTPEPQPVRRRRAVRVVLLLPAAFLVLTIAFLGTIRHLNTPPAGNAETRAFAVRRGESVSSIAQRLQQERLVRSARFLSLLSMVQRTQARFQSGNYLLNGSMTSIEIHDFLVSGRQQLIRVTVPEGWTIRRIAAHLERHGIVSADEFVRAAHDRDVLERYGIPADSAQGFLYPDTYLFHEQYPAERVVGHMIDTFFRVLREMAPEADQMSERELFELVKMASIIEREYITPEETALMASVFYNRLNAGMRLESCATVVYVMTEEEGLPHPNRLFYRDLERPSPYNTYRNNGLPPGPISNPGRAALTGALHPAETDYWFFVLRGANADRHHFSSSLQEHNQATVLYLRTPR